MCIYPETLKKQFMCLPPYKSLCPYPGNPIRHRLTFSSKPEGMRLGVVPIRLHSLWREPSTISIRSRDEADEATFCNYFKDTCSARSSQTCLRCCYQHVDGADPHRKIVNRSAFRFAVQRHPPVGSNLRSRSCRTAKKKLSSFFLYALFGSPILVNT